MTENLIEAIRDNVIQGRVTKDDEGLEEGMAGKPAVMPSIPPSSPWMHIGDESHVSELLGNVFCCLLTTCLVVSSGSDSYQVFKISTN